MTEQDLIYLAGFFDGDGCVALVRSKTRDARYLRGENIWLQASLSQNPPDDVLRLVQNTFGGFIRKRKDKANLQWGTANRKAADFLAAIYPYLRIKQDEARIALRFQGKMRYRGSTPVSEKDWQERVEMYEKMRQLKCDRRND